MRRFAVLIALAVVVSPVRGQQPAGPPFRPAVRAGNVLYVSGALPTGADGKMVPGGITEQTRRVMENLKAVLQTNGTRMERVAAATVYLKRASDFAAMNEVYRSYWPTDPPARTTVVANLVAPDALLEISMVALLEPAERVVVQPAGWARSPYPSSSTIRSGDTVWLAGIVARNPADNTTVKGDVTAQATAALKNAREVLEAAKLTFADVVSARVFLTDTANFDAMNAVWRAHFPKDPPARATVRTGLTNPDYLIEITLTAVAGRDRQVITTPNADGTPGKPNANLSSAIRVGNRLFLSGMLGNTDTNAGDLRAQTGETLARIARTLRAAGFDLPNVVDSTVYLTNAGRASEMNEGYRLALGKDFPARATIEAGLVSPSALVEIMMSASK